MASEKQMLANQKNALKSTGPKTAKGKALAKRNSRKHGLWAKDVVITEGEGAEERLQRMRLGHHVPAPIQLDINTSGPGELKLTNSEP